MLLKKIWKKYFGAGTEVNYGKNFKTGQSSLETKTWKGEHVEKDLDDMVISKFPGVVVGKVLEVKKHPNADRLRCAKVDIGDGQVLDIVCGAPNLAEGQLVPVAKVGTILPGGMEMKEATIRGEKSFGMICAEDELGLGEGHEGIMTFADSANPGDEIDDFVYSGKKSCCGKCNC